MVSCDVSYINIKGNHNEQLKKKLRSGDVSYINIKGNFICEYKK